MNNAQERYYKPELDGLRFFAFLLVFCHHSILFNQGFLKAIGKIGWIGVDLFFALSAFLFAQLLHLEIIKSGKINFKKFIFRRIFRIWPVYIIFLAGATLFYYTKYGLDQDLLTRTIGLATFTDNIVTAVYGYNFKYHFTPHLWTISFEEQFYLTVPFIITLLVKLKRKKRHPYYIGIYFVLLLLRFFLFKLGLSAIALWVLPIAHFDSLFFGLVLGLEIKELRKFPLWVSILLIISLITFIAGININMVSLKTLLLYPMVGLITTLLVYQVLTNRMMQTICTLESLVFLGKRSYGLYLYHFLGNSLGFVIASKILQNNVAAGFFLSLFITIILSVGSYLLIEKPFLKLKKKFEVIESRPA